MFDNISCHLRETCGYSGMEVAQNFHKGTFSSVILKPPPFCPLTLSTKILINWKRCLSVTGLLNTFTIYFNAAQEISNTYM